MTPQPSAGESSLDHLAVAIHFPDPETVVVTASGEVDAASAPLLRQTLDQALDTRRAQVVVDLNELTFMDATTLDLLVQTHHRASATGATLHVRCDTEHGRLLFTTVGLEYLLDRPR